MDATDSRHKQDAELGDSATDAIVCCHETRPGRRVFTERGNSDGWISSNVVVTLRR